MKKVLIAEDDSLLAQSLEGLFAAGKCEVKIMSTGVDVVQTIAAWNPDVILLDIMLPGKNGIEIVKDACDMDKGVCNRIIVMTTLEDNAYLAKALEQGITNYVQKSTSSPQYVYDIAMKIMNA